MRAIKVQAQVSKDHTIRLQLPEDVQEGPAEVIVLVTDARERGHSLKEFLADLAKRPSPSRSREEIEQHLKEERASWGEA
jgi:hypothetical protein